MNAMHAVFLVVSAVPALPGTVNGEPARDPVYVAMHNDGLAHPDVARRAQAEVTRLYALIDVAIVWVDAGRQDVGVRVLKLTTWEPSDDRLPVMALGVTYSTDGRRPTRGYVFWMRVQRYAQQFTVGVDMLLGAAMAHELGHMLLPSGSHTNRGLMQATWDRNQFRSVSAGLLHFSPQSAAQIRRGVTTMLADNRGARGR